MDSIQINSSRLQLTCKLTSFPLESTIKTSFPLILLHCFIRIPLEIQVEPIVDYLVTIYSIVNYSFNRYRFIGSIGDKPLPPGGGVPERRRIHPSFSNCCGIRKHLERGATNPPNSGGIWWWGGEGERGRKNHEKKKGDERQADDDWCRQEGQPRPLATKTPPTRKVDAHRGRHSAAVIRHSTPRQNMRSARATVDRLIGRFRPSSIQHSPPPPPLPPPPPHLKYNETTKTLQPRGKKKKKQRQIVNWALGLNKYRNVIFNCFNQFHGFFVMLQGSLQDSRSTSSTVKNATSSFGSAFSFVGQFGDPRCSFGRLFTTRRRLFGIL